MSGHNNIEGMSRIAQNYAAELDAQFRTLNSFTSHPGEIGRVHEFYLRSILRRFLPSSLRISTGFVAGYDWTSSQQDILVFEHHKHPPLFDIGELVVVAKEPTVAAIEVKTNLGSKNKFRSALESILRRRRTPTDYPPMRGLIYWEGLKEENLYEAIEDHVLENPESVNHLPDVIYKKGSFILFRSQLSILKTSSYDSYRPEDHEEFSDGLCLMGLVMKIYRHCMLKNITNLGDPWWLGNWGFPKRREPWNKTVQDKIKDIVED